MPSPAPSPPRGLLVLAFAAIFVVWGTTFLAIRYAVETIPPLVTAGVRHGTAGSILFALAWARGYRPRRSDWLAGSVLGALFFLAGHGLLHWAEQHIASGLAGVALLTVPELGELPVIDRAIFATLTSSLAWSLGVVVGPLLRLPEHPLGRAARAPSRPARRSGSSTSSPSAR